MGRTRAQQDRANETRRIRTSKQRQSSFISDYIQVKYFDLYSEAAGFFNALNTLYPSKYDITKTQEYRSWRMELITGQRKVKAKPPTYESIDVPMNMYYQNTDQQPESHELSEPQSPESEPQSPESEPQSPESEPQSPESEPQSPESEPQSPESEPQSPENNQQLSEKEPWKDNMQLRIPLLRYNSSTPPNSERTVTTQTIEIITEQTLDQSSMDNNPSNQLIDASINENIDLEIGSNQLIDASINESIDLEQIMDQLDVDNIPSNQLIDASINENIDRIIQELRKDPDLHNIFNEMELSQGIDIEQDIRLENELLNW